jgi:hypothetical protein
MDPYIDNGAHPVKRLPACRDIEIELIFMWKRDDPH